MNEFEKLDELNCIAASMETHVKNALFIESLSLHETGVVNPDTCDEAIARCTLKDVNMFSDIINDYLVMLKDEIGELIKRTTRGSQT